MNIYAPERQQGESFADYKERRAQSHKAVARILDGTPTDPMLLGKGPSSTDRERANVAARRPARTEPKLPKERTHKQHKHPLRDGHGAYTLVGKPYELDGMHPTSREAVISGWVDGEQFGYTVARRWLGGISAQRGY